MASQIINLSVFPRGKPIKSLPKEIAPPKGAPSSAIYQQLASVAKFPISRLRITKASDGQLIPNSDDVPILQNGLLEGSKIYVKDLGSLLPMHVWLFDR